MNENKPDWDDWNLNKSASSAESDEVESKETRFIMNNDEDVYLKAAQELLSSERNEALWVKSNAITGGDQEQAKYTYIKLRVEQLKDSQQKAPKISQSEQNNSKGSLLLELTEDFSLFENCFVYKGDEYSYERISSVYHHGSESSVNFMGGGSVSMSITLDESEDEIISFDKEFTLIKSKYYKNISIAANIISKKTFRNRLSRYINKLKTQGFISIIKINVKNWDNLDDIEKWEVKIYENGDVVEKDKKFNLKKAYNNKSLQIGYSAHLGIEGKTDPYEVIVSESGTSFWNKKIKFNITSDYDVMVTILKSLAGIKK